MNELKGLRPRLITTLKDLGITTREALLAKVKEDGESFRRYRGIGPVAVAEIRDWLDLPTEEAKTSRTTARLECPCCGHRILVSLRDAQ